MRSVTGHLRKGSNMKLTDRPTMKPSAAIDILVAKVLPKLHDVWEHDALVVAIQALEGSEKDDSQRSY